MAELDAIRKTPYPRTRARLTEELRAIGVAPGMVLIVHSSLSKMGWVCGGPVAVVQALMDALTVDGTLVMPTQTGNNTDPAHWVNPPVPQEWWQVIRDEMPAYDPQITPSLGMGVIVETFRTFPGVVRSRHPTVSFAAWGRYANWITAGHSLDYGLGEQSPLARIYDLSGWILLLGVGHNRNTSLHLAEYRAPGQIPNTQGSAIFENGQRVWRTYADIEIDSEIFPEVARDFERTSLMRTGLVGSARSQLLPQRAIVDFATHWYTRRRGF